ncbi:MAG: M42 family peptidase [Pseudomonadota bacterium]|jgi:putative aminopeptidase FrvX
MDSKDFLHQLLLTPSPPGAEQRIQRVVREQMKRFADTIETDLHGNVIMAINPNAERRIMLAGHCDQIALMIRHISSDGFLYVSALGGIDVGAIHATKVTVYGEAGPIAGIIGRKPIHLQSPDEREKNKSDIDKLWIDIGARNKREAEKLVQIGDIATFELGVLELGNNLFASPGLDDKVGLFVALETLRLCAAKKRALKNSSVGLFAVSTVQEELGLRGATTSAYQVNPTVGIAIDVTHASDNPANENPKMIPCILGAGPAISSGPNINPVVEKMLRAAAKKTRSPFQSAPSTRPLANDANSIQTSRGGVATAAIGIPNRYMHTPVEVCHYKDLEWATKILTQFVLSITPKTDFRPT